MRKNKLTKEDVWGDLQKGIPGMIVARGAVNDNEPTICPIFGDVIPYKSVTVVCGVDQYDDVTYWLTYVHGSGCLEQIKKIERGSRKMLAIRSNYMCW